jgi:hypothetical protein
VWNLAYRFIEDVLTAVNVWNRHRLKMFENRVLRGVILSEREVVIGG